MSINRTKIKRILIPIVSVFSLALVVLVLLYVNREQEKISCDAVNVNFLRKGVGALVSEQEVRDLVMQLCDSAGSGAAGLSTAKLENAIEELPAVKNAEVYRRINGELHIEVEQRIPVCRVHELSGSQYYLDESGEPFPVTPAYTARVPLVNGNLYEPYNMRRGRMDSDSMRVRSKLDDVSALFRSIRKESFRMALIEQVWVAENGDFELIPKIDDHVILFGDTTEMDGKFNKLKIFYEEGLNTQGWNSYQTVNLKYKNQIICKK